MPLSISLSRPRARMYRLLAAVLRQAQHMGHLAVAELLEMAQGQHLAVQRLHGVEHLLKLQLHLGTAGGAGGRGEPAQQHLGQRGRVRLGRGAVAERHFLAGVPHVDFQVMPVQRLERLAGQEAEPEERRHGRLGEVFPGPAGHLEIGVLEHVGRVDAPLQPPVEAEPDHPPQPLAVPGEQLGQGPLVPPFEADEQVVIVSPVLVVHDCPHFMITAPWTRGKPGLARASERTDARARVRWGKCRPPRCMPRRGPPDGRASGRCRHLSQSGAGDG